MQGKIIETYDYTDEAGVLLYQNCRFEPKDFRPRRRDGNGDWFWNLDGTRRVLYRLKELLVANPQEWVFYCEGEKDVENLLALGLTATTAGAVHSWKDEFAEFLNDRKVCILPHNDKPGKDLATRISTALIRVDCPERKTLNLPGLAKSQDVSDWLANGGTKQKLLKLTEAEPEIKTETLLSVSAADILPEKIEWFWDNKIPAGTLTIIAGDPGSGKSFLSLYLASQISIGGAWPDCDKPALKGSAILIGDEDDPAKVIVPRLIAHKADRSKIEIVSGQQSEDFFNLTLHLDLLDNLLKRIDDCQLVVIDPITAYLGATNANSNAEVRAVLCPLANLAAERNVTIIGTNHFNKKQGESYIYRGLGSTAFVAQARSAWGVMIDKDDRETRILCPIKSNYCIEPTGLKFRIIDGAVQFEAEPWTGHIDDAGSDTSKRIDDACNWLREYLGGKSMTSTVIFEEGEQEGFSRNLLYRAKNKLKIRASKLGFGDDGQWVWELPKDA